MHIEIEQGQARLQLPGNNERHELDASSDTAFAVFLAASYVLQNMMPAADDDVNIACFHPEPGMGCVYGTKQGRVCIVSMATD